ncbi:MAG TPA: LpqB family beta-propeller domain-containing protein [Gemmatimonadaceae bacterium]|nr:LpqB family beta-propeller domain-containing protein [Gemmatimonadaceae bacterium]
MQQPKSISFSAILVCLAVAVLAACEESTPTNPPLPTPVASVEVTAPHLTMQVGEQMTLVAKPKAADGAPLEREVTWRSEDGGLATVSAAGVVTAVAPGQPRIIASSGGHDGDVRLTVQAPVTEPDPPPVTQVILQAATTSLDVGERVFFGVQLKLASGEVVQRPVAWQSSAPLVASATSAEAARAAVEARATGTATITVSAEGVEASVTVQVSPAPTSDLIYSVPRDGQSEIFVLGLAGGGVPVRLNAGNVSRDPSPSPDGSQFAFAVSQTDPMGAQQHDLFIVNRDGLNMRWLTRTPGMEREPAWSPDGARILFSAIDASSEHIDIWVVNVDGSGLTNLTAALGEDLTNKRNPAWSPDGSRIAFVAAREGQHKVWTMNADGSGAAPLTVDFGFDQSPSWSPAGDRIAFSRYDNEVPANGWDIMIVELTGAATTRLSLPGDQLVPAWSPDGEHIAVAGTQRAGQGVHNLYTLRPDGSGLRLRTPDPAWGGGLAPAWIKR